MFRVLSARFMGSPLRRGGEKSSFRWPSQGHRLEMASATKEGRVHVNEDRVLILENLVGPASTPEEDNDQKRALNLKDVSYIAVFDGHCGQTCADFMVKNLHRHIVELAQSSRCTTFQDLRFILPDAFKAADEEFCAGHPGAESGSCGAIALIYDLEVLVAHIGDCRVVLRCRGVTTPLTRDHRPSNETELRRVISNGGRVINGRVGGIMSPTRSFGDLDVRGQWGDNILISEPDIAYVCLEKDSEDSRASSSTQSSPSNSNVGMVGFLMLGTDGVFDEMSCDEACRLVEASLKRNPGDPQVAADRLVKAASAKTTDDCTVAIAIWSGPQPVTPSRLMSKRPDWNDFEGDVPITILSPRSAAD